MRLRLLFTLGLVLTLSTFASPKESTRCGRVSKPAATPATPATPATAKTPANPANSEHATLLISRLLYI